jgi:pimeloyl-ACP methyl ester carboxylesterase
MTAIVPATRRIRVGAATVAYVDVGTGPPILLLHRCPFSKFMWRNMIPRLNGRFRCVAPDLLGLGDTETPEGTDWTLRTQLDMVLGLLDRLGLDKVALVGHDQGGAIAQLLATAHSARMSALVLADAEAYHNRPSAEEIPFVHATQVPVVGRLLLWAWSRRRMFRWALAQGQAVHDRATLTDELVDGYIAANLATAYKRAQKGDSCAPSSTTVNQTQTCNLTDALRRLDVATLILWATGTGISHHPGPSDSPPTSPAPHGSKSCLTQGIC